MNTLFKKIPEDVERIIRSYIYVDHIDAIQWQREWRTDLLTIHKTKNVSPIVKFLGFREIYFNAISFATHYSDVWLGRINISFSENCIINIYCPYKQNQIRVKRSCIFMELAGFFGNSD